MSVHPGAWWVWALAVATAGTLTTNLLVLALLLAGVCLVTAFVAPRDALTGFRLYLVVAAVVVAVRLLFRLVFPTPGGTPLLTLPTLSIGDLDLFGTLTTTAALSGLAGGLQLAVVIVSIGAAHTVADVLRLLRHAPPALAGLSTALVIAVSVFPELTRSVRDVRRAARLRGRPGGLRATAIPVLEATMDRSVALAAAMEARGFGGTALAPGRGGGGRTVRRIVQPACVLVALLCVALAAYGLLDHAWPGWSVAVCASLAVIAAFVASALDTSLRRSVYRPDVWTVGSTLTALTGVASAVLLAAAVPGAVRVPSLDGWPPLTLLALTAPLLVLLPALTAQVGDPARTPAQTRAAGSGA